MAKNAMDVLTKIKQTKIVAVKNKKQNNVVVTKKNVLKRLQETANVTRAFVKKKTIKNKLRLMLQSIKAI